MGKNMATKVIKIMRPAIEQLIKQSAKNVVEPAKMIIEQAKQLADQSLSAEINRLYALQAVNKNIRPEEIEQLESQRTLSLELLNQANWRLDSLRVIVSNKE